MEKSRSSHDTPIPLWIVGPRRPADRERRKDPGSLSRHEQDRTGAAPRACVRRRSTDVEAVPNFHMVSLWIEP